MAGTGIGVSYDTIARAIAVESGWDPDNLTGAQAGLIDSEIHRAVRQVCAPLTPAGTTHEWSWLVAHASLTIWPDAAGVLSDWSSEVVTADGEYFQTSMAGRQLRFTESGTAYHIVAVRSKTQAELDRSPASEPSGSVLVTAGRYRLPSNFGGFAGAGVLTVEGGPAIPVVDAELVRMRHSVAPDARGYPKMAAFEHRLWDDLSTPASAGSSRWDLIVWPPPDRELLCYYRFRYQLTSLGPGDYLPGDQYVGELFLAAALAVAEVRINGQRGARWQEYQERLLAALAADAVNAPTSLGPMAT